MNESKFIPYQQNEIEKNEFQELEFVKHFKAFYEYEKFQKLSLEAIHLYGFMVDRLSILEQHGELLRDKDDHPFILMSEEEMAKSVRASVQLVKKLKKQLIEFELIKQHDTFPNVIYVGTIQVSPFDKKVNCDFEL